MPAAVQLPAVREPAKPGGRRLYRKQILPLAKVEHPEHGDLDFTREVLEELVANFNDGAMTQVPFVLVTGANSHPDERDDPERVRGEVRSLDLANDGLYALIEPSERGEALLRENPRLPVSVRLTTPTAGPFKGRQVLAHVCGTMDEIAKHMKDWETVDQSSDGGVLDLSSGEWSRTSGEMAGTDATTEQDKQGALSDEEKGLLRKIADRIAGKTDDKPDESKKTDDEPSDEEVQKAVEQLLADASEEETDEEKEGDEEKEPVAASLSDEDRKAIDMAAEKTKRFELKAGKAELDAKLKGYVKDGVPPAMVEAARDLLSGDETLIELANDREPSAAKKTFEALDKAKNTIEFSERGSSAGDDTDDEASEAKKIAEQWKEMGS